MPQAELLDLHSTQTDSLKPASLIGMKINPSQIWLDLVSRYQRPHVYNHQGQRILTVSEAQCKDGQQYLAAAARALSASLCLATSEGFAMSAHALATTSGGRRKRKTGKWFDTQMNTDGDVGHTRGGGGGASTAHPQQHLQ
ncbi:MAG: hypothetical protein FRX49_00750 [Trebouxia sp. A1-2]|nr:MAG: hypothetical protein FRX49_00750 [Trebouxia sp. A1-2]